MNEIITAPFTAVVTGPTGAIGISLCMALLEKGCSVLAVCRKNSPRKDKLPRHNRLRIVECDLSELSALPERAGVTADVFFHLGWGYTVGAGRNNYKAQVDNVGYTLDAVSAAAKMGCEAFVFAGSQAEYGRVSGVLTADTPCFPENGYGIAKLCAGQMSRAACADAGIRHICTRILSVYGPYDSEKNMIPSVINSLLRGEKPSLTPGGQKWDYLSSSDAAQALILMAMKGTDGAVYPLGSGTARPLREYVEILRDLIDPKLQIGFGEYEYQEKQVMHLEADISALTADTGFAVQVSFEKGIKETIDFYRSKDKEVTI